jgi:hypothetical protein
VDVSIIKVIANQTPVVINHLAIEGVDGAIILKRILNK